MRMRMLDGFPLLDMELYHSLLGPDFFIAI